MMNKEWKVVKNKKKPNTGFITVRPQGRIYFSKALTKRLKIENISDWFIKFFYNEKKLKIVFFPEPKKNSYKIYGRATSCIKVVRRLKLKTGRYYCIAYNPEEKFALFRRKKVDNSDEKSK